VAVLLPPDRRSDAFRYVDGATGPGAGARRILGAAFSRRSRVHPLDVWEAVLASPETARRLVGRLDLTERWGVRSEEDAVARLQERLTFEAIPYGGFEIRARTHDPELSAELANAAAEILDARLRELYRTDVEAERAFLADALRDRTEAAERAGEALAAARARAGIADEEAQDREAAALAEQLVLAIADARTQRAVAERVSGKASPAARDAAARVDALERAAAALPPPVTAGAGGRGLEEEAAAAERAADLLDRLRLRTVEHQAGHDVGVSVLDPAVPAERPDRAWLGAALLAFLVVPGGVAAREALRRQVAALPARVRSALAPAGRIAGGIAGAAGDGRLRAVLLAAAAAGAGLLFSREPLALAGVLGCGFLIVLAADLRAAWLLLVIALPWAWDYVNPKIGLEVQFPTEPGIVLLFGAWVYAFLLRPRRLRATPLLVTMGLTLAWMAVASVTSVDRFHSVRQVVSSGGLMFAGAVFPMLELRRVEDVERVLRAYLVSGAAIAVFGIVQVIRSPLPFDRAAFFIGEGLLYNHGPYAAFLGFVMGPAFVYLLTDRWSVRSVPVLLVAILVTVATVVSLTRAAWLATIALLVALLAVRIRVFLRTLAIPLAIAALVLIPAFLRSPAATRALESYVEVSTSAEYSSNVERLNRWLAGVRMVRDRPLLGVGPGAYETAYDDYRDVEFSRGNRGAHSEILRAASEQGIPGAILLVVLVSLFFRSGWKLTRPGVDPRVARLAWALCAGMFTYVVHGQVNEYWRLPKIALTVWVFVGLLGALERIARGGPAEPAAVAQ
jgi:O-antigen ligase